MPSSCLIKSLWFIMTVMQQLILIQSYISFQTTFFRYLSKSKPLFNTGDNIDLDDLFGDKKTSKKSSKIKYQSTAYSESSTQSTNRVNPLPTKVFAAPITLMNNQKSRSESFESYLDYEDDEETTGDKVTRKTSNSWKTLMKKLDAEKPSKNSLGKTLSPNSMEVSKLTKESSIVDELRCKHFDTCGGCTVKGNFTILPVVDKAKMFFKSEGLNIFPINIYEHHAWRTHVKLAVQPLSKWGGLKFGLYKPGTHEVEPIPDCKVHHPRINEAIEVLKTEAAALGVKGYQSNQSQKTNQNNGELRYIQVTVERHTNKVQLVLVWNCLTYKDAEQTLPRLVKRLKSRFDLFHSIHVNFQTSSGNAIFNYNTKSWKLLWGLPTMKEKVGCAIFNFRPQIFRQANLDAFEKGIIPLVVKHVFDDSKVAELYSGIGIIGLNVVSKSSLVLCSDSNEFVDDAFDSCVETLPEDCHDRIFYENLPAEEAILQGQCDEAQVLIVDPPRKGLDKGVLDLLLNKHDTKQALEMKRLIYVSCGYEALERDMRQLLESGFWKLVTAEGFLLFPGSDHIETVVVLDRIGSWKLKSPKSTTSTSEDA